MSNTNKSSVSEEIPYFLESIGISDLMVVDNQFYVYNNNSSIWKEQPSLHIRNRAYNYAKKYELGDHAIFAKQMLEHLQICYFKSKLPDAKKYCHLLRDGSVLDATTASIIPNEKDYYLTRALGAGYDPEASCPLFLDYLNTCFAGASDKAQRIAAIQEFAASMFLQDARFQNFMILHGIGGEGKSILLSALRAVIGRRFTASLAINHLSEKFKTCNLKGMLANLSDESRANAKIDADMLKALSAGNPITVEQKNKAPEELINHSKMIFAMNQFPMLGDSSRGMERRMIVISFPNPIAEEDRDIELEKKITAERDGIFLWMLDGLKRINETKKITVPPSSVEIVNIIMTSDPLTGFVNDFLTILPLDSKPSQGTLTEQVYTAYKQYCEKNGSDNFLTANNFTRRMREKGIIAVKSNGRSYFKATLKNTNCNGQVFPERF